MEKGPLFNSLFSEDWVLAHTSAGFRSNFSYLFIDEYIFTEKENLQCVSLQRMSCMFEQIQ